MNFRKLILLVTIFIGLFSCKAQKSDYDNSVLWEIKKPGSNNLSYILGTIHVLDTTQIIFPSEKIKGLIDKCENLCLEVIPGQSSEMLKINEYLYLRDENQKISKRLETKYYNKLIEIADSSIYALKRYKPYLDSMRPSIIRAFLESEKQLINTKNFKALNYKPESDFLNHAKMKGFGLNSLETTDQQIEWTIRPDLSFEESLERLKQSIDNYNEKSSMIDIFKKYSDQNLAMFPPEDYTDSIMIHRNQGMVAKIDSIVDNKSLFVAIGAGHLPYENGVLNLLAQKGYIIKPYKIDIKNK
nr:TraB/GumN family protein [uncultured Draconibacterium sp.]